MTFTADEAVKWGYADDKAESVRDVMSKLDYEPSDYTIEEYRPDWLDHLIGFFTNPAVQAILIMIIVGGIYMELHSPGVGFPRPRQSSPPYSTSSRSTSQASQAHG